MSSFESFSSESANSRPDLVQRNTPSNRRRKRGRRERDRARRRRENDRRDDSWYFPDESDDEIPWIPARNRQVTFPSDVRERDYNTNITPVQSLGNHRGERERQLRVNNGNGGNGNAGPSVRPLSPLATQSNRLHALRWDNDNYRVTVEPSANNQPNVSVQNRASDARNDNESFDPDSRYDQSRIATRTPVSQPASQVRSPSNRISNRSNLPNDSNEDVQFNLARSLENRMRTNNSTNGGQNGQLRGGFQIPNARENETNQPGNSSRNDNNLIPNGSSGNIGEDNSDSERWYSDNNNQRGREARRIARRNQHIRRGNYHINPLYAANQNDTTIPVSTAAQVHRAEYNTHSQSGTTPNTQSGHGNNVNPDASLLRQNVEQNPATRYEPAYRRQEERNARNRWRERQRRRQRLDGQRRRDRNRQRNRPANIGSSESMDSYDSDDMSFSPVSHQFRDERYRQNYTSSDTSPSRSRSRGRNEYSRSPSPDDERMNIDYFADDDEDSNDDYDYDEEDWLERELRNYKDPAESQTLLGEFIRDVAVGRVIVSRVRKRITKQYFRRGDFQLALADFRSINPEHTRQVIGVGFTGTVANTYRMTVKQNSSFGKPTLEIRPMNRRIRRKKVHVCYKIRYFTRRRSVSGQQASGPSPNQNVRSPGSIPVPPPLPPLPLPAERPPRHHESNDNFL